MKPSERILQIIDKKSNEEVDLVEYIDAVVKYLDETHIPQAEKVVQPDKMAKLIEALEKISKMPLKATRIKEFRQIAIEALAEVKG